jgi:hypothetical protein
MGSEPVGARPTSRCYSPRAIVMKVEILYFGSCPSWRRTVEDVQRLLAEGHLEADVQLVAVSTDDDARRLRLLGSPTVRVDGVDVDPAAEGATTFGMQCRIYEHEGRLAPSPPASMIRAALGLAATP